jgi:hypothetical protein
MEKKIEIKKLVVEYDAAISGCLPFKVTACDQSYYDVMSCYWDPLPDLKKWLESIVIGVQQCSFKYDNEGQIIKFDFKMIWQDHQKICQFSVFWNNKNHLYFRVFVEIKQLVNAFYCATMQMFDSEIYNPKEWEWKNAAEETAETLNINEKFLRFTNANPYEGASKEDFRSEIIENYLKGE